MIFSNILTGRIYLPVEDRIYKVRKVVCEMWDVWAFCMGPIQAQVQTRVRDRVRRRVNMEMWR